jgi:hypothetical protein
MFYTATYAAMNVGAFAVISHAGGYDDRLLSVADYRGLGYSLAPAGRRAGLLSAFADRHSLYRRLLRQVLRVSPRPCTPVRSGWRSSAW